MTGDKGRTPERELAARTRRSFLTLGVAAAAGYGGWRWLRSRPEEEGLARPFRKVLQANEKVAGAYFSEAHRVPRLDPSKVDPNGARLNGDVGLDADFDPTQWKLGVHGLGEDSVGGLSIEAIRALPRVEQITNLNCIEGWSDTVHWTGARFSDFTAKYAPQSAKARYVSMVTPDKGYFVGLDMPSALHPQTLLCYEIGGKPLTLEHGAPLRLVIPVKYGVKNIKRIATITYTNERPQDYWANEGYDWYAGL